MGDKILSDEIKQEEFDCADFDYKSAIKTENIDNESDKYLTIKTEPLAKNENEDKTLVVFIKREHDFDKNDLQDKDQQEIKYSNKKVKLEHIDIEENTEIDLSDCDEIIDTNGTEESDPLGISKSDLENMIEENYTMYFGVKRIFFDCKNYKLLCCNTCQYSTIMKDESINHAIMHIEKSHTPVYKTSDIYDYFVCSVCDFGNNKRMGRYDMQTHLKIHKDEKFPSIIGVKLVDLSGRSELLHKLHFCQFCDFVCVKYDIMVLHLIVHNHEEVVAIDEVKYNENLESETESASSEELVSDSSEETDSNLSNKRYVNSPY